MFSKILRADKAMGILKNRYLMDEQKYIMARIKQRTNMGYDTLDLGRGSYLPAMEKYAFDYVVSDKGNWLIELGYKIIHINEEQLEISWEIKKR